MSLKKSLKRQGQSILEYFILLTIIASLTILAASTLYRRTQYDAEEFVNAAAAVMAPDPG